MRSRSTLAALLASLMLAWAPLASAANRLEAARAEAKGARAQVTETRHKQQALRAELSTVSARIEAMKARGQSFLSNPELDAQLRRSQELASSLAELARALQGAEAQSERSAGLLLEVVNEELVRVRAGLDAAQSREQRKALIGQLRALRAEREQLRAQLPASAVPSLSTADSDDPEELLEQADALRDSEDKLRAQMKALQARLTEAREERELDRRIADFSRDESMFDDSDRRLRLRRESTTTLKVERAPPLNAEVGFAEDVRAGAPMGATTGAPSGGAQGDFTGNESADPSANEPGDRKFSQSSRATDALPQVGKIQANGAEGDDVAALEQQLQRMAKQADELGSRAGALESKAKMLE